MGLCGKLYSAVTDPVALRELIGVRLRKKLLASFLAVVERRGDESRHIATGVALPSWQSIDSQPEPTDFAASRVAAGECRDREENEKKHDKCELFQFPILLFVDLDGKFLIRESS
jgi:hypothetical protein